MKKCNVSVVFMVLGILMLIPCIVSAAGWSGTWNVKRDGSTFMTFILNESGNKVTGTWSTDLVDGKIALTVKGSGGGGGLQHPQFGYCQMVLTMSPSGNEFTGRYTCREGNLDARHTVKGIRK